MADPKQAEQEAPETQVAQAEDQAPEAVAAAEPSITLASFAQRFAWVEREGLRRPARELMGGFVHEEKAAGRLVGKLADFRGRWEAFRKRKA